MLRVSLVASLLCVMAFPAGADSLEARLAEPLPPHPRLLVGPAGFDGVRAKVAADPALAQVWAYIESAADHALTLEPIRHEKVGRRLLGVSREALRRVMLLAFAHSMTDNPDYLRGAERVMLDAAAFPDWNPSHFLDVAEMTTALAIGYDWLHADLTPEAATAVRDAILHKGLEASFPGGSWVRGVNNWNQVCHGGLSLGALAIFEHAPDRAREVITRAVENLPRALGEYEPDGVYPEGPSYWDYGTSYNVLLVAALESALGNDFGLVTPPLLKSAEFFMQATGPTGLYFNFADGGTGGSPAPAMYWFAQRLGQPALLWHERDRLAPLTAAAAREGKRAHRLLPCLLLWAAPLGDGPPPVPQRGSWHGGGHTPLAILRSGWDRDAAYLATKGGSPSSNHGHMDIGAFVFERDGVRWAVDLGAQSYHDIEARGMGLWNRKQDSDRWKIFRLNNHSHNTLVVDGALQRVDGRCPITAFDPGPDPASATVDMGPVYAGQLAAASRTLRLDGRNATIEDRLTAPDRAVSVRWGMATNAEVTLQPDDPTRATLRQDGQVLPLHIQSPPNARWEIVEMETPPAEWDAKNPNTRMLVFTSQLDANAEATLTVHLGEE